jgi:sulfite reductase subunit B
MHKEDNIYRSIKAEVLDVITETPTIKTIRFKPKEPMSFATGQFIQFSVPGVGEGPFTPSSNPYDTSFMDVTIMKVGRLTEKVHELKKGDAVGIRGPYGQGYPIEQYKGREVLVVAGGCGFAPLRSLMYSLINIRKDLKDLVFRGGCRNPQEIIYKEEVSNWDKEHDLNLKLTVDKGDETWKGNVGLVTGLLNDVKLNTKTAVAVVCGPPVMMKFVTFKLVEMGYKDENIYLSMEKNMSCAIGKCGHCRLGNYYACKDGPVFTYDKIKSFPGIWD